MIVEEIDANIERIQSDLLDQGLTYSSLLEDILDHVCCMVEKEMIVVPGASHLFEEPGALEQVAGLASRWFISRGS